MTLLDPATGEMVQVTLAECERVIENGLDTFVEVGNALLAIRDGKLYKTAGYKTFESYCQERWSLERSRAYRLMDSAQVISVLSPTGDIPGNEHQARFLAPLKDDPVAVAEAWVEAKQRARENGQPVTAEIVRAVVAEKTGHDPNTESKRSRANVLAREEAVARMARQGYRSAQIAAELDVGREAVVDIAKRVGVEITADKVAGRSRRPEANRIVSETIIALEGIAIGLELVDYTALDDTQIDHWVSSLTRSLTVLQTLKKQLKELTRDEA